MTPADSAASPLPSARRLEAVEPAPGVDLARAQAAARELLVALGADPTISDTSFDAPAAGWARHAHHHELADWLEERAS
jgi:hypothetical protein